MGALVSCSSAQICAFNQIRNLLVIFMQYGTVLVGGLVGGLCWAVGGLVGSGMVCASSGFVTPNRA